MRFRDIIFKKYAYIDVKKMVGRYARGEETEQKILREFAKNKEVHQYKLNEKVGVSYRTVLRVLHALKKRSLLKIVGKKESKKRGKEKNVWAITIKGLLMLLTTDEQIWQEIDLVARRQQDKLLTLKKWQFFKDQKVQPTITYSFKNALEVFFKEQISQLTFHSIQTKWTDEEARNMIDSMALGCFVSVIPKLEQLKERNEILRVLRVCKKDDELSDFVESQLRASKKRFEAGLAEVQASEKLWAIL